MPPPPSLMLYPIQARRLVSGVEGGEGSGRLLEAASEVDLL